MEQENNLSQLVSLIKDGDLTGVKSILKQMPDPDIADQYGQNALSTAIFAKQTKIVELLLKSGAKVNFKDSSLGTPLMKASSCDDLEIAILLLKNGASVNDKNILGLSPLYFATNNGHLQMVKLLVEKGADINSKANNGSNAISIAREKRFSEITRFFREIAMEQSKSKIETEATKPKNEQKCVNILDFCQVTLEKARRKPEVANKYARELIEKAKQHKDKPENKSTSSDDSEYIAHTLSLCAIIYSDSTQNLATAVDILERALEYAVSRELKSNIQQNITIFNHRNKVWGNIKEISSPPPLVSVSGIGFDIYGKSDEDQETGSYLTTYCFTFFYIPLFAITRYRVRYEYIKAKSFFGKPTDKYIFMGKTHLRDFEKIYNFVSFLFCSFFLFSLLF
jgi:hypothetical protein